MAPKLLPRSSSIRMSNVERRVQHGDRRRVPRGGRRAADRPGRHPPVLVADSYTGVRQPCARYLDRFHFQAAEAADGEKALALIIAIEPHVILAEWSLPAMPGARLSQWLAQNWRTRDIPVIFMTGSLEPHSTEAFPQTLAGLLVKPFSLAAMLEKVRRALRARGDVGGVGL